MSRPARRPPRRRLVAGALLAPAYGTAVVRAVWREEGAARNLSGTCAPERATRCPAAAAAGPPHD